MQTDPTLLANITLLGVVTCCVRLQEPQQCWHLLALVAYSLKPVKLLGPCKRTQHCWPTTPNNVGSCWHLLRPFAWALTSFKSVRKSFRQNVKTYLNILKMAGSRLVPEGVLRGARRISFYSDWRSGIFRGFLEQERSV